MSKIRFKIDEKSLFYGMYNDYKRGQTVTVSTPINQSKNPAKWHKDIMKLFDSGLEIKEIPDRLKEKCLNKTTSQANSELKYFFEFKKIYLDGEPLKTDSSFGIYVKEEIDKYIKNKKGKIVENTHLGRLKLHYPMSLLYKTDGFNIDNMDVLKTILVQNGGFAYVVRGFECDTEEKSINFLTSLVGLKGVFLSNIFRKKKGIGQKLLVDEIDLEAQDISIDEILRISKDIDKKTAESTFDQLSKIRVENGKKGEEYVINNIKDIINDQIEEVYHTSKDYPTSPYDIEYIENGIKKYIEVKATSGVKKTFNMSSGEIKFMERYKENYKLILVTDVKSKFPKIDIYECDQILSMNKQYPTTRFFTK